MKIKKYYTIKEWSKFKKNNYFDMQEILCQRYDVILADHKTRNEKIISILKKFNQRNFDKAMKQFNNFMKDFGNSVDPLTREINTLERDTSRQKNRDNIDLIWGKTHNSVPVWCLSDDNFDSQTRHEANLEKIWGKKN